jgi:pentose-5-phosphate-3-epimerase
MSVIVPAILPTSRDDLDEKLLRLHGLVDAVQVDVVDGRFVTPASWPYKDAQGSTRTTHFLI